MDEVRVLSFRFVIGVAILSLLASGCSPESDAGSETAATATMQNLVVDHNSPSVFTEGQALSRVEFERFAAQARANGLELSGSSGYKSEEGVANNRDLRNRLNRGQELNEAHFEQLLANPDLPESVREKIREERDKERVAYRDNAAALLRQLNRTQAKSSLSDPELQARAEQVRNEGGIEIGSEKIPVR